MILFSLFPSPKSHQKALRQTRHFSLLLGRTSPPVVLKTHDFLSYETLSSFFSPPLSNLHNPASFTSCRIPTESRSFAHRSPPETFKENHPYSVFNNELVFLQQGCTPPIWKTPLSDLDSAPLSSLSLSLWNEQRTFITLLSDAAQSFPPPHDTLAAKTALSSSLYLYSWVSEALSSPPG